MPVEGEVRHRPSDDERSFVSIIPQRQYSIGTILRLLPGRSGDLQIHSAPTSWVTVHHSSWLLLSSWHRTLPKSKV
jgi:hypothetical protein